MANKNIFNQGQVVKFKGYVGETDSYLFDEGDLVTITDVETEENEKTGKVEVSYHVRGVEDQTKEQYLFDTELESEVYVSEEKPDMLTSSAPTVVDTTAVRSIINENSNDKDVLDSALSLVNSIQESFFTLGGVLSYIHTEKSYKQLGGVYADKQGFGKYTEDYLDLQYGKAMSLIKIYNRFTELGFDEKKLTAIGWSKARAMVSHVNEDNYEDLLSFAESNTRDDLVEYCKQKYVSVQTGDQDHSVERMVSKKFQFSFLGDQAEMVQQGISVAMDKLDTGVDRNENMALYLIVADWLTTASADTQEVSLEDEIAVLELKHGVKLTLDDNDVNGTCAANEEEQQLA